MSLSAYLSLSAAVSTMSVWYIAAAPALYCTAVAAGICMEIWSLCFFIKAVWDSDGERQSTCMGVLGSLFGALAFGCRPTIALANILAVPIFIRYVKGKQFNLKLLKQILAVFTPYIVIGSFLMVYNYVRFEDPFEFGLSFLLTNTDMRQIASSIHLTTLIKRLLHHFVKVARLNQEFPYISHQSVLLNFPVCLIAACCLLQKDTLSALKKNGLMGLTGVLLFLPILIIALQIVSAPYLYERYRLDVYWLMGILVFLLFGHFLETLSGKRKIICGFIISLLAFVTIFRCFLLWTVPCDGNFTALFPEYLYKFEKVLRFGL